MAHFSARSFGLPFSFFISVPLLAQVTTELETRWWQPNGTVRAIAEDAANNTVYMGGEFTSVMPPVPFRYGASLSLVSGVPRRTIAEPDNIVNTAVPDGSGGWFIAGVFSHVGDSVRSNVAHINANGTVNAWKANTFGTVQTLLLKGDTVILGGVFEQVNGVARKCLALVHRTTGQLLNMSHTFTGANESVLALALSGDTLYCGGSYTAVDGVGRSRLCAFKLSTGNMLAWNPGVNGSVNCLDAEGPLLYVGGLFTVVAGAARNYLATVNIAGPAPGTIGAWNPNGNNQVNALVVSGTSVFIGGTFSMVSAQPRSRLAQVSTAGVLSSWTPNANGTVNALIVLGSTVYVGGAFTAVNSTTRNRLAALGVPGSGLPFLTSWDPNANGQVNTLATGGGRIYAGGQFTAVGTIARQRLVAFDIPTGEPTDWNPSCNGTVQALHVANSTVFIGGQFGQLGTPLANRQNIGAVPIGSDLANGWNPGADQPVYDFLTYGTDLYVCGAFDNIAGVMRNGLAALNPTTGAATPWNVTITGSYVGEMALAHDTLFFCGALGLVNGNTRQNLAAVVLGTNALTPLTTSTTAGGVGSFAKSGNRLYCSGLFEAIGGQPCNPQPWSLAAVDAITGLRAPWVSQVSTSQLKIAANDHAVYHPGNGVNGNVRPLGVYGLSPGDGTTTGFYIPTPTNIVLAFELGANGRVYCGGDLNLVGATPLPGIRVAREVPLLKLHAALEGAWNVSGLMTDHLRSAGLIPLVEPFTALGYMHIGGGGGEVRTDSTQIILGNDATVDWVLVELRSAANPAVVVASRSALIQRDGDIVDHQAHALKSFAPDANALYYIALRHRNHLGVMTAAPVKLSGGIDLHFENPATAVYGTEARTSSGGTMLLWAGNVTFNGELKYTGAGNDRDPILVKVGSTTPNSTVAGYWAEDVTMDGTVQYTGLGNDRDPILVNVGSTAPNSVRLQQLP